MKQIKKEQKKVAELFFYCLKWRKKRNNEKEKFVCDSALFERTKATENVLFSEWTIYIAQSEFVSAAVPFPTCCIVIAVLRRQCICHDWMREAIIGELAYFSLRYTPLLRQLFWCVDVDGLFFLFRWIYARGRGLTRIKLRAMFELLR